MSLKAVLLLCVAICTVQNISATDYTGDNLLKVLGENVKSKEFKEFKDSWDLNPKYENAVKGIKLYINASTGNVDNIFIAAENTDFAGEKFQRCISSLPFNISVLDDQQAIKRKLGYEPKVNGRTGLKFFKDMYVIDINFNATKPDKISTIKFYRNTVKNVQAMEKQAAEAKATAPPPSTKPATQTSSTATSIDAKRKMLEQTTFAPNQPITASVGGATPTSSKPVSSTTKTVTKTTDAKKVAANIPVSPFKKSILDVFNSWKESGFYSIKSAPRGTGNFWNYKYTYATKLKVPGEAYNMLYSFPFINSELDFVSVIRESDSYDQSIEIAYHEFEKKLLANFQPSDGWTSRCLPNTGNGKLSNLEFRNDKYGSVILDYTKSPKGKHVVYLRFLLYS